MITDYVDRLEVGQQHVTGGRTITETDLVTFAMFTGDWHPIHTNVEYAEQDPRFGQRIAHGALVLSVSLGLVDFWPDAMKAFYGIDRLRFVAPTYIGDTIHVETEIADIARREDGDGVVTSRYVVAKSDGTVCVSATLKCLVAAEPSSSPPNL